MIEVEYSKPKKLKSCPQVILVRFRYKQEIVNTIRKIQERIWHDGSSKADNGDKYWELSYDSLSFLKEELPHEEFVIKGKPISEDIYIEIWQEKNGKLEDWTR